MQRRHVLANSCARATSAAEARYRIEAPIVGGRSTAVFALDAPAQTIVDASRHGHSPRVRFLTCADGHGHAAAAGGVGRAGAAPADGNGHASGVREAYAVPLEALDAPPRSLADAVADADLVVMVATSPDAGDAAAKIGDWCAQRRIMTAGLAVGPHDDVGGAVSALRPHARMLLVSEDASDLDEMLTALRA